MVGGCGAHTHKRVCQRQVNLGSGPFSVIGYELSAAEEYSFAKQVEPGSPLHLPSEHLDSVHILFGRAGTVQQSQSIQDRSGVGFEPRTKRYGCGRLSAETADIHEFNCLPRCPVSIVLVVSANGDISNGTVPVG